jgi:hypothetical protein
VDAWALIIPPEAVIVTFPAPVMLFVTTFPAATLPVKFASLPEVIVTTVLPFAWSASSPDPSAVCTIPVVPVIAPVSAFIVDGIFVP